MTPHAIISKQEEGVLVDNHCSRARFQLSNKSVWLENAQYHITLRVMLGTSCQSVTIRTLLNSRFGQNNLDPGCFDSLLSMNDTNVHTFIASSHIFPLRRALVS